MFLKSLTISSDSNIIREIKFRKGINLIVDESENQITGNDVGKTTTLKLIDFCLGADANKIYLDPEYKTEHQLVKQFLTQKKVLINLVLTEDLDDSNAREIEIERNFLLRKDGIRSINGENFANEDDFKFRLGQLIFPNHRTAKPTFRQIISGNIRYDDATIANTLKTFPHGKPEHYESLHLFLFGSKVDSASRKQELLEQIQQESNFQTRLSDKKTKTTYEVLLSAIEQDIKDLNAKKATFNVNKNFEKDLDALNQLKYQINKMRSEITQINIRRDLILEAKKSLEAGESNIDVKQLQIIYQQATNLISNIQKTFEELVSYHNQMVAQKVRFITQELPALENKLNDQTSSLQKLLAEENRLASLIAKSDTFEALETVIIELNEKFRKKGEYENIIKQLTGVEQNLKRLRTELEVIDDSLFSADFEEIVKRQRDKFNRYFTAISKELYNENYLLNYNITTDKKGKKFYEFTTFDANNPNLSSGKKQGEISCFDIAYILFADEENMPCLHFVLNDKKELMHDNQLAKIAELVNRSNMQFVASILKDKLPASLNNPDYFVLTLSQNDKLFRIESFS